MCFIRPDRDLEDLIGELRVWFQEDRRRAQELIKQFPEIMSFGIDQE